MSNVAPWFVVDGEVAAATEALIPAWDALARPLDDLGDGLFETLLVTDGEAREVAAHLARLAASAAVLGLAAPSSDALAVMIDRLVRANASWLVAAGGPRGPGPSGREDRGQPGSAGPSGAEDRALRLTVTPARTWLYLREVALARRAGLHLWPVAGQRARPHHKTLAWSPVERLHPAGADPAFEALWLDRDGAVLEGNRTNLFAVIDDVVLTAPLTRPLLPGIARARALVHLAALGIPVREDAPSFAALADASEVFATSSLLPVAPVTAIEGTPKSEGPVTRALRVAFTA